MMVDHVVSVLKSCIVISFSYSCLKVLIMWRMSLWQQQGIFCLQSQARVYCSLCVMCSHLPSESITVCCCLHSTALPRSCTKEPLMAWLLQLGRITPPLGLKIMRLLSQPSLATDILAIVKEHNCLIWDIWFMSITQRKPPRNEFYLVQREQF